MFSAYLRAAILAPIAVLLGAVLSFILSFFMPYLGPEDGQMYQTFQAIDTWVVFLFLIAIAFMVIVRSVIESEVPR
ncbi:MAG: hypothetical protein RI568_13130 [Natronomonas sp.]|uniref:hypothetical protein n=1 Tax=Natronomonas sp. TaxID=2184060 RepID=UPI00286FF030|nr:hypothetical protein [Natronomonas sp.]MDR9431625.1 hypothetical protein [Natronomonas sp.]